MFRTGRVNGRSLPLLVEPAGAYEDEGAQALSALCRERREELGALLLKAGALLLRGFGRLEPEEFAGFVRAFSGKPPLDYVGGASPRVKVCAGVYTSTEYPRHYTLSLHNELSYNDRWPAHLFFYCARPADAGGATPVADSRVLLKKIRADVVAEFRERKVKYVRRLHGGEGVGLSWRDAYETDERVAVEEYCRAGGFCFGWTKDGGLWTSRVRPGTHVHPLTGEEVWFNQADAFHTSGMHPETYRSYAARMSQEEFPHNAYRGDGSPLDPAALAHVREVMAAEMALFEWRAGDVLVLDNVLASHGRMPFEGARRILVAMT